MTTANILAGVIFGSVGFVALIYGKKQSAWKTMVLGAALMVYPYFMTNTILLYVMGAALTAALFIFRD